VKKEKEQLMINVEQLKKEATKKEEAYANQQSEFERLNKQLAEANDERKKQMKQLQQVRQFQNYRKENFSLLFRSLLNVMFSVRNSSVVTMN
jgi:septation ring formation regulator EzrA